MGSHISAVTRCTYTVIHTTYDSLVMCEVMEDYLTTPYQDTTSHVRTRSQSVSSRINNYSSGVGKMEGQRNTPLRASSFSPGSLTVRDRLSFSKLSFRSRSSSVSSFSSSSTSISAITN